MQFINIREFSRSPSKYIKMANEDDDVVILKMVILILCYQNLMMKNYKISF